MRNLTIKRRSRDCPMDKSAAAYVAPQLVRSSALSLLVLAAGALAGCAIQPPVVVFVPDRVVISAGPEPSVVAPAVDPSVQLLARVAFVPTRAGEFDVDEPSLAAIQSIAKAICRGELTVFGIYLVAGLERSTNAGRPAILRAANHRIAIVRDLFQRMLVDVDLVFTDAAGFPVPTATCLPRQGKALAECRRLNRVVKVTVDGTRDGSRNGS